MKLENFKGIILYFIFKILYKKILYFDTLKSTFS